VELIINEVVHATDFQPTDLVVVAGILWKRAGDAPSRRVTGGFACGPTGPPGRRLAGRKFAYYLPGDDNSADQPVSCTGIGALMSALLPGLGVLILGYSIFEGVGTALLIPPVYILTTMLFDETTSRARAFGVISGMGGIGAAAGPLLGGLITTAISWRAAFVFQAMIVATVVIMSRRIQDPVVGVIALVAALFLPANPRREGVGGSRTDLAANAATLRQEYAPTAAPP
jgi:MFS family permease